MNLSNLLTSALIKVVLVSGCLLSVACADVEDAPQVVDPAEQVEGVSGPREVTTDVAYGPCEDGFVRECTVVLPSQNGVKNCVYGLQLCEGGVWSECQDPDEMVEGISELDADADRVEETTESL